MDENVEVQKQEIPDYQHRVTEPTRDRIIRWHKMQEHVRKLEEQLQTAKRDFRESERALALWLSPADAHTGETFNIWFGDGLVEVYVGDRLNGDVRVKWRTKPSAKVMATIH